MSERKKITRAGLEKKRAELDYLIAVVRTEIAREIEFARSYGDLSENAEYTEAKKKQAENESRIAELQDIIANAEVVEDAEIDDTKVSVGTTVTLVEDAEIDDTKVSVGTTVTLKTLSPTNDDFMVTKGEIVRYAIVGDQEADPLHDRISDESEVGRSLVGAAEGDKVTIPLDGYTLIYQVKSIERGDTVGRNDNV